MDTTVDPEDAAGHLSQPSQPSRTSTGFSTNDTTTDAIGSGFSPDMSDDESLDLEPHDRTSPSGSVTSMAHGASKEEPDEFTGLGDVADAPSMPVQKRRRVTRACDECRRKKIKCDGKQPCTHCSVYSYECTYDKPSNRRRNPAPQYIEALENKLQRAETLLRKFMPEVDLSDPNLDPTVQQEFRNRENSRAHAAMAKLKRGDGAQDSKIMSMIETIGQLDLSDDDKWDFHGISSGAVFLRRMKENFRGLMGHDYRTPFLPRAPRPVGMIGLDSPRFDSPRFESPKSSGSSPWDMSTLPNIYELPPREKTRTLCYYSLNCATCLLRIVHVPSFYENLDRLYEQPAETWGPAEHRFLGLLYSIMALGCMYDGSNGDPSAPTFSYKMATDEGIKYYASARLILQDIAECRDMMSLQALVFMILFVQATSNISGCYAYVGIALRSAMRMGLHRHLPHAKITPIEDETRRRVFHVVRQIDIYVSASLGFPMMLHDEDIDQPPPTEVDDEYITKDAILQAPAGTPSFFTAFNAHNQLMSILAKVVKYIYPLKGVEECVMNGGRPNATYMISYCRIKEIERDLQDWYAKLPEYWRPGQEGPVEVVRVRTLLRFGYAHVQMMLYRPFLHYVSRQMTEGKSVDDRYYACAAACISISRNIIHIGIEIRKQALLIGPYWFMLYTQFFAILSLAYYVVENPDKAGSTEIFADASHGRDSIVSLAQRSLAADRVTQSLNALFEQLPERLKEGRGRPAPSRKRSAPAPKTGNVSIAAHPALQENIVPTRRSDEMARPRSGPSAMDAGMRMPQRSSFDSVGLQQTGVPGQNFAANLQELLPLDLASTGPSSDSGSTPGTAHLAHQGFQQAQTPTTNPLYKVDAMMFPSGDPFAYPAQPLMDFTGPPTTTAPATAQARPPSQSQAQDAMQFYGLYDDIEGQLLGPIPGYLQQGLDLTAPMYNTSGMLILQQGPQGASHQQHHHHLAQQRHQRGNMDDIMGDPSFRSDWDVLRGGDYQPM